MIKIGIAIKLSTPNVFELSGSRNYELRMMG